MTALHQALADVAVALTTDDRPAFDYVPEDIGAPAIVVQPGSDYLAAGETFGEWTVRAEVVVCVDLQTNAQAAIDLDDALEHVVTNLPEGWGIDSMTQPGPLGTTDWTAHGITVRISRYISNLTQKGNQP